MAVKKNESVDKNKALENAIKQITKDFGRGIYNETWGKCSNEY